MGSCVVFGHVSFALRGCSDRFFRKRRTVRTYGAGSTEEARLLSDVSLSFFVVLPGCTPWLNFTCQRHRAGACSMCT